MPTILRICLESCPPTFPPVSDWENWEGVDPSFGERFQTNRGRQAWPIMESPTRLVLYYRTNATGLPVAREVYDLSGSGETTTFTNNNGLSNSFASLGGGTSFVALSASLYEFGGTSPNNPEQILILGDSFNELIRFFEFDSAGNRTFRTYNKNNVNGEIVNAFLTPSLKLPVAITPNIGLVDDKDGTFRETNLTNADRNQWFGLDGAPNINTSNKVTITTDDYIVANRYPSASVSVWNMLDAPFNATVQFDNSEFANNMTSGSAGRNTFTRVNTNSFVMFSHNTTTGEYEAVGFTVDPTTNLVTVGASTTVFTEVTTDYRFDKFESAVFSPSLDTAVIIHSHNGRAIIARISPDASEITTTIADGASNGNTYNFESQPGTFNQFPVISPTEVLGVFDANSNPDAPSGDGLYVQVFETPTS